MIEPAWRATLWQQCGAAIDMLERAVEACPETMWSDRGQRPEFWYVVFHTLFYLDLYLSESLETFAPPAPFTRDELDPEGTPPERPYTKAELRAYLVHGRGKCREAIASLTDARARERRAYPWGEFSVAELLLYNLRHVQHHVGQLNLMLRQQTDSAPRWVVRASE